MTDGSTPKGNKDYLLGRLKECERESLGDTEAAHAAADDALLNFIDDDDVRQAFWAIRKWYA